MMKFVGRIWKLFFTLIFLAYLFGCLWYKFVLLCTLDSDLNFIEEYGLDSKTPYEQMRISVYFMMTTLTTIGYGDYLAVDMWEWVFVIIIMLIGVGFFGWIMGFINAELVYYEEMVGDGFHELQELDFWIDKL